MRLEPLCTFEWSYDAEGRVSGGYVLLQPFGGEDGAAYGEGRGTVTGDRLAGTCVWSNHPRRRGDGRMLPNVHGLIVTDDGAEVRFTLHGITVLTTLAAAARTSVAHLQRKMSGTPGSTISSVSPRALSSRPRTRLHPRLRCDQRIGRGPAPAIRVSWLLHGPLAASHRPSLRPIPGQQQPPPLRWPKRSTGRVCPPNSPPLRRHRSHRHGQVALQ